MIWKYHALEAIHYLLKDDFGNVYPLPHVRVRKIFQTLPSLFLRKIYFVFQHNKMKLEKNQLHFNSQFDVNQNK